MHYEIIEAYTQTAAVFFMLPIGFRLNGILSIIMHDIVYLLLYQLNNHALTSLLIIIICMVLLKVKRKLFIIQTYTIIKNSRVGSTFPLL